MKKEICETLLMASMLQKDIRGVKVVIANGELKVLGDQLVSKVSGTEVELKE